MNYIVRMETIPIKDPQFPSKKPRTEIWTFQYESFDEAFLKLFTLSPEHFDYQLGKKKNIEAYHSNITLHTGDYLHPIAHIAGTLHRSPELEIRTYPDKVPTFELKGDFSPLSDELMQRVRDCIKGVPERGTITLATYNTNLKGINVENPEEVSRALFISNPMQFSTQAYSTVERKHWVGEDGPPGVQRNTTCQDMRYYRHFHHALADILDTTILQNQDHLVSAIRQSTELFANAIAVSKLLTIEHVKEHNRYLLPQSIYLRVENETLSDAYQDVLNELKQHQSPVNPLYYKIGSVDTKHKIIPVEGLINFVDHLRKGLPLFQYRPRMNERTVDTSKRSQGKCL